MIWVAKERRRQGLAKELSTALAARCGMGLKDFAHTLPFRGGVVELWKTLNLSNIYLI
jgi:hypothetical protein